MHKKNGLSRYKVEKVMRAFAVDMTATQTAEFLGLNRNTVNRYFGLFRARIAAHQAEQRGLLGGTVEVDESYFGPSRPRGVTGKLKRGRGTKKQPVFGIIERGGRVYAEVVPDANKATLQGIIRGKVALDATIVSDGWKGYDGLVDMGFDRHLRIKKSHWSPSKLSLNGVHINGIESFWSFTKRRLAKFNGVTRNFEMHLKECEWRWGRDADSLFVELKRLLV